MSEGPREVEPFVGCGLHTEALREAWLLFLNPSWSHAMSLSSDTLQALRNLIEKDPALLERLRQVQDAAQGATLLSQVAQQAGIDVDTQQLRAYLESTPQHADAALSDAQLDQVAGGMNKSEFIAMSVFSFAIGCAVVSQKRVDAGARPAQGEHPLSAEFCLGL